MTMKMLATTLAFALLTTACGEDAAESSDEMATAPTQPTDESAAVEAPQAAEVEATPEPEEPAATGGAPAEGETTTLLALREGFAADASAWAGRTVTVEAQFMSATNVGGSLNNISLVVNQEDYAENRLAHSMMCAFGDGAPESVDLRQYQDVTVRGTVVERFGRAGLDNCEIVD